MKNNSLKNLNLLVRASLASRKLPTVFYSLFILICTALITISVSIVLPLGSSIDAKINNHISNRELIYTPRYNDKEEDIKEDISLIKEQQHVTDVYEMPSSMDVNETSGVLHGAYKLTCLHKQSYPVICSGRRFEESEKGVAVVPQKIKDYNAEKKRIDEIDGSSLIGKTLLITDRAGFVHRLEVVGSFAAGDPLLTSDAIIIPRKEYNAFSKKVDEALYSEYEAKGKTSYIVLVDSPSHADEVEQAVGGVLQVGKLNLGLDSQMYNITLYILLGSIAMFVLLTATGFYLFLRNNISNRINELALYRSIGYKTKHIFYVVFAEHLLTGLASIAAGVTASLLLCLFAVNPYILSIIGGTVMEFTVSINPFEIAAVVVLFLAILLFICARVVKRTENIDLTILLNER